VSHRLAVLSALGVALSCSVTEAAAPNLKLPQPCERSPHIYQWRDANGGLQISNCPPTAGGEEVRKIPRASLRPTLIQPPPAQKASSKSRRKGEKRSRKKKHCRKSLSAEQMRSLSSKCRWLIGRIEHLKGLVALSKRHGCKKSVWQPTLSKRKRELKEARCGVRL